MDIRSIICQNSVGMVQFPMKHVDNIVCRGLMFISDSLPFVKSYIEELDGAIKQYDAKAKLSKTQKMGSELTKPTLR